MARWTNMQQLLILKNTFGFQRSIKDTAELEYSVKQKDTLLGLKSQKLKKI